MSAPFMGLGIQSVKKKTILSVGYAVIALLFLIIGAWPSSIAVLVISQLLIWSPTVHEQRTKQERLAMLMMFVLAIFGVAATLLSHGDQPKQVIAMAAKLLIVLASVSIGFLGARNIQVEPKKPEQKEELASVQP